MARLPTEVIERVKREISLLRWIESQGYALTKQGKDMAVCCPFHDDKTPSCIISPKSNLFNCFGCGKGGSVIDWVMHTEKLSFRPAIEKLLACMGENVESLERPSCVNQKPNTTRRELPSFLAASSEQELLQRVVGFYHKTLLETHEAKDYLAKRGLDDASLIEYFTLGYANRSLGLSLPLKNRKAGADIRNQLIDIGVYRDSGHEHFNGSLVIPIINNEGVISEVYGRKLLGSLRKGTPKHLYLPGAHAGVFNPACLSSSDIILCESLIDALTFWRHGFKDVTCSYGTGGFTDELLDALTTADVQRVLIAYDRDDAGNTAAEKVASLLMEKGIECYRVLFPKGMDANDYALTTTPAAKALALVLEKADYLGEGDDPRKSERTEKLPMQTSSPVVQTAPQILPSESHTPLSDVEVKTNEIVLTFGERYYRVRGLEKNTTYEQLKINILVSLNDAIHVDQLELYNAKARQNFIRQAAIELGVTEDVIKKDVGKVLLKLETLQDAHIQNTLEKQAQPAVTLSDEEHAAALDLLRDPSLISRLLQDFNTCGVVGEETNKLVGYLACVSRKLDKPLAVIIQSTSAAGKSALMNAVLAMIPEEERVQYSAMTGQSLFYMGETNLKHKILAIAEEEGAEQASYALKLLQSEGEVSIASTGKNDTTGNLETKSYTVEGPVMLFLTTTAIDIDEELMNRCVVLTVNESREQTEAIHALQRKSQTLDGLLLRENTKHLRHLHQNAQRLLRPLKVVNPYAEHLTFLSNKTRTRRDHMKYLQLINSLALLHQYQREVKTLHAHGETIDYIEVTPSDIEQANRLAHDVLGRSLDELPPQTRKLLRLIEQQVMRACETEEITQKDYRFSRKGIRDFSGWSDNQLKVHCRRLEELEYLLVHRGSRGHSIEYELLFNRSGEVDDNGNQKRVMGLLDTKTLKKHVYDAQKLERKAQTLVPSCAQVGAELGDSWRAENTNNPVNIGVNEKYTHQTFKTQYTGVTTHNGTSHNSTSNSNVSLHASGSE